MSVDPQLLEILVCPACRAAVTEDEGGTVLVCSGCGFRYPVRDDIPIMLIDEAEKPPLPGKPGKQQHPKSKRGKR